MVPPKLGLGVDCLKLPPAASPEQLLIGWVQECDGPNEDGASPPRSGGIALIAIKLSSGDVPPTSQISTAWPAVEAVVLVVCQ